MIKRFTPYVLAVVCLAIVSLAIPEEANAQLRNQTRYTRSTVNGIINRLENSSDRFRRDFDRAMDNSSLNGTNAEDRYNGYVRDYENQLDQLRRSFDRTDSWWTVRNEVEAVIRDANPVNNMMNSLPFRRTLESQWNRMRTDINSLADTYDLPGLNGGGWNGGGGGWDGGGSGQTSTPPSWAQGTFYSSYPAVTMTINRNGQVTSVINGQTFYGRFYRGSIYAGNEVATVTRMGNGIRTYNQTTGQTIDFNRNWGGGGGGGGGGNWEGPTSNPPSWAVGTFASMDGSVRMTINRNGQVTSVVNGQTYYGRYYFGSIYSADSTATVSQWGNGIRTYNRTTGQTIDFRRR